MSLEMQEGRARAEAVQRASKMVCLASSKLASVGVSERALASTPHSESLLQGIGDLKKMLEGTRNELQDLMVSQQGTPEELKAKALSMAENLKSADKMLKIAKGFTAASA